MKKRKLKTAVLLVAGLLLLLPMAACSLNGDGQPDPTSILVIPRTSSTEIGQTQQMMAIAAYSDGSVADVTLEVSWESSDGTVASVSQTGLVTAQANGRVTISASLEGVGDSAAVQVGPPPKETVSLSVSPAVSSVMVNQTKQYVATAGYSDGSSSDVTASVAWTSSDESVVTIDAGGLATGQAAGDALVTATLNGFTDSADIKVVDQPREVVSIDIAPTTARIGVGLSKQFTAQATYSDGSSDDVTADVTWSSSDQAVITIDAQGMATGQTLGSADIGASLNGKSDSVPVDVVLPPTIPSDHYTAGCTACHSNPASGAPQLPPGHSTSGCESPGCHVRP